MADNITLEGDEALIKRLSKMASTEEYKQALKKACALVERSAKEKAPKGKTGELRRSIKNTIGEMDGQLAGLVYTALEYAPYVEYGTGIFAEEEGREDVPWSYQDEKGEWHTTYGREPKPYMRPALYENRQNILRILKEGSKGK